MKNATSPPLRTIHRALDILECLGTIREGATVSEMARKVGLHVSTVHRLLGVLKMRGYADYDPASRFYRVGSKLFEAGSRYLAALDLPEAARPHLEQLRNRVNETVHLAIYTQGEVVELAKVSGGRATSVAGRPGARYPAYCTALGKVLLAHLPPEEFANFLDQRRLVHHTSRTITTPHRLKRELRAVVKEGYALDCGEMEEDLYCIGVPIWGPDGRVRAALSVAMPEMRFAASKVPTWLKLLQEASQSISRQWGLMGE
ncbi:MAG: IclR family transcriptional regulator [candidate division NC10 bacterium]|nr:IclR family transcriptional regulator [candidate division NC10 bacterium]